MTHRVVRRAVFAIVLCLALLVGPAPALAWYLPEHVTVTTEALREVSSLALHPIERTIEEARKEHFLICPRGDLALEDVGIARPVVTKRLKAELFVNCVPYSALPAMAGDHSVDAHDLEQMVYSPVESFDPKAMPLGHEIVTATALEWKRFLADLKRDPLHLDRAGYVHALDVFLYFLDDTYVKRTTSSHKHFHDAGKSVEEVALAFANGKSQDNVLAQVLLHHLRSLQLARGGPRDRVEALFEHAFALHFLSDAFSAGHLVQRDTEWIYGDDSVRARHDFFGMNGVRVRRAQSTSPCDREIGFGLAPCWLTYGDGHLGLEYDAPDRAHLREATRLAIVQFALALDPDYVLEQVDKLPAASLVTIGSRLDAAPWWIWPPWKTPPTPEVAKIKERFEVLAGTLKRLNETSPGVVTQAMVSGATHPIDLVAQPSTSLPAEVAVGRDVFAPLIALWPAVDGDIGVLTGELKVEHGFAYQLYGNVSTRMYGSAFAPWDIVPFDFGASMGLAYRVGNYVPGRVSRALFEANAGLSIGMHVDTGSGDVRMLPFFQQELRWPALYEIVTTYKRALSVKTVQNAGYLVFLSGMRMHELVSQPRFAILGFDLEVAAWAIARGNGTYPTYQSSPEFRFHLGMADPSPLAPSAHRAWGPYLSVTLTGGYATFF